MSSAHAPQDGGASTPATGTYRIDPVDSAVRFMTRSFGIVPVKGTFPIAHGQITVADPAESSAVRVTVDVSGFTSGNGKRDTHVLSGDYLDAAGHPEIVFNSDRVERSGGDAVLHGELTVRGVTRPMEVSVTSVEEHDGRLIARGTASVDRYAFGITAAKGMTGRVTRLYLEVVAER
ncbi:YceI family protein [Streptomyces tsukubensis]|uniref:Lipid/polyisoprenoid-binding YceI-like domain-containing protein n=1 Tax=Streptomyces tsukubensis TaxID=83656 RepID=A0A1V4A0I1_9ACTN|nr:YceI family protein [Streptomyces tsukubensis]OON72035.1 hypothetical protein B1H18_31120 [Streptomyces tsukubensis]